MKLSRIALLLACAGLCSAQVIRQGDIEIIPTVYGIPCEPGELQFGLFPCPPVEKQGVMIHVRADDWKVEREASDPKAFVGYLVTVAYRTATEELKTATCGGDNPCPQRTRNFGQDWDDGWRAVAFQIGRVAIGPLSGIRIESVSVTKIPPPTATITIGKTEIGPPILQGAAHPPARKPREAQGWASRLEKEKM